MRFVTLTNDNIEQTFDYGTITNDKNILGELDEPNAEEERQLQWWVYVIMAICLFFVCLLLNYIVKKINDARLEERFYRLNEKTSKDTQIQNTEKDKKLKTVQDKDVIDNFEGISMIFSKEANSRSKPLAAGSVRIIDDDEEQVQEAIIKAKDLVAIYSIPRSSCKDSLGMKWEIKDDPRKDDTFNETDNSFINESHRDVLTDKRNSSKSNEVVYDKNKVMISNLHVNTKMLNEFITDPREFEIKYLGNIYTDINLLARESHKRKITNKITMNSRPTKLIDDEAITTNNLARETLCIVNKQSKHVWVEETNSLIAAKDIIDHVIAKVYIHEGNLDN